jgi:hypothetical protein
MFEENVLESGESAPVEAESLQSLPLLPRELTRSRRDGARQEEASAATLFLEHAAPSQPSLPADRREGPPIDMRRQSRSLLRLRPVVSAAGAFLLASIIGAGYVYVDYIRHFESTDDAFIAARQSALAPKVSGYITAVPVNDNEHVAAGDMIARIDDRDYRIALDQAEAQVAARKPASRTSTRNFKCSRRRSAPARRRSSRRRRRWCSLSSRTRATRTWRKKARAPSKTRSSIVRSYVSSMPLWRALRRR